MAWFKNGQYLTHASDDYFDKFLEPNAIVSWAGIYRCIACGREVVRTAGQLLPPPDHHRHEMAQGRINWQLIVTEAPYGNRPLEQS